ncbi:MAG: tetratricopeptide repeat protein [Syntrophales bacterium]|nr:tetratricopeptide repeat protein [Syntrophales bacterium]
MILLFFFCGLPHLGCGEMWCVQSPVYSTEGEAKKEMKRWPHRDIRIEKVSGGYVLILGTYASADEARNKWEKTVSVLPGSVIRRCDGNPTPEIKVTENQLLVSALKKKKGGNFHSALEDLKKALELEQGKSSVTARILFEIASCYENLNERELARDTYRKAVELDPTSGIAPLEVLYEEGFKAYKRKEFSRAMRIFSHYHTLYPKFRAQAYYFMACCLMELKQYRRAMYFFDIVIKEYPETIFATESLLALGNIGLIKPKIKVPLYLAGFDFALNPISAYNEVLKRDLPPDRKEQVLLSKAFGYMSMERPDLAHRVLVECVRKFAHGPYRAQARLALSRNLPSVLRMYEEKKDDLSILGVFFQVTSLNLPFPSDINMVKAIARAFKSLGFMEELQHFLKVARVKVASKDVAEVDRMISEINRPAQGKTEPSCEDFYREYQMAKERGSVPSSSLTLSVAECLFRSGRYGQSIPYYDYVVKYTQEMGEKIWAHLRLGQAQFRAGKKEEASKIFSTLKEETKEEFWTRVVESLEESEKWVEKYHLSYREKSPGMTSPSP